MEILWPAIGIGILAVFAFGILFQHWQRLLRHHSWTIRRLTERLRDLEEVGDPEFRRRLGASLPSPLEQVITFTLRLDDRFWRDTLDVSADDLRFIRACGTLLGSVKIERWRSHSVVSVTEVLPESRAAGWQTRKLEVFSGDATRAESLALWELPLERPNGPAKQGATLRLVMKGNCLELRSSKALVGPDALEASFADGQERILFQAPLDSPGLAGYRSLNPMADIDGIRVNGNSWLAFYSHRDEEVGFDWQLWLRDLSKRQEWESWRILETVPAAGPDVLEAVGVAGEAKFSAGAAGPAVPPIR